MFVFLWLLFISTQFSANQWKKKKNCTVWSLCTGPSVVSPCDQSVWDQRLSSTFCQKGKKKKKSNINFSLGKNNFLVVFRTVWTHLYWSCVSRSSFFSSSILSVVNLRTMTSSMVSTTSPFSPRLRLEQRQDFHTEKFAKKIQSNQ